MDAGRTVNSTLGGPRTAAMSALRRWRRLRLRERALLAAAGAFVTVAALEVGARWAAEAIPLPARLGRPPSTVVRFADGSVAHVLLSPDDRYRMAARLDEVDPDHVVALLRLEDKRFFEHAGVDGLALGRAVLSNLRHGRVVSGASTITMQLVRVLEPRPRTVRSKLVEMLRAAQLERRLSKREILEAYLTFVPYGRNLEGIEAASLAYFGHGAADLSAAEIATLLAVPQAPARRHPRPSNSARLRAARDAVASRLAAAGALRGGAHAADPGALLEDVRRTRVPERLQPVPRHAPHAVGWLTARYPGETELRTTLDRGAQLDVEARLRAARGSLEARGIGAGACVVVEHATGRVLALVGNLDFWADRPAAQVTAFDVPRSPGSALKPFIHALAIDRGLVLPEQLVRDVPTAHGDYRPDNYDGTFSGLVRLDDALRRSLNVPFVNLLGRVGVEDFLGFLRLAGVRHLRPEPGWYGLSAAIGSVEVTPLEMASLHATLAREGLHLPLRFLEREARPRGLRLLSPGAAWLTRQVLLEVDRRDFPSARRFVGAPTAVAWKTGTSFGHRDAWAVGSGPSRTAAVWLGNLDNAPSSELVGAEAAGPILFDVLEALEPRSSLPRWDGPPLDLAPVRACAYSGYLPTAACGATREVLAPRAAVPTERCPHHVLVDVDLHSGHALNPGCRAGRRWETRRYLTWPSTVRRWLSAREGRLARPPTLDPACVPSQDRPAPAIVSPPPGLVVVLLPGLRASDQELPLEAESHAPRARLSWFLDGAHLGTVDADDPLWWTPREGEHELLVMDDAGRSARRRLLVSTVR